MTGRFYWVHFHATLIDQPVPVQIVNGMAVHMSERITEPEQVPGLASAVCRKIIEQQGCPPDKVSVRIFSFHPFEEPLFVVPPGVKLS